MGPDATTDLVTVERDGHVLRIGVDRQDKANAWDAEVIRGVAEAYRTLRDDEELRVGLVFGHGKHFTGGLDLAAVAPIIAGGDAGQLFPEGAPDPFGVFGEPCPKPIVLAVQGRCNTLGIELALASQLTVAADDTVFAQLEVARGILPFGGGTFRLPARLGGDGLRYLLTAEDFDAAEALRIGLVQEVVPRGRELDRATELAQRIAANAPLGVQAALANARAYEAAATQAAAAHLTGAIASVLTSADALEGIAAMGERREPRFEGR